MAAAIIIELFIMSSPSSPGVISNTQINTLLTILSIEFIVYIAVLAFLGFNFWRIMIKQRKISLIPLTIFYFSAALICTARAVDCICFLMYYHE